MNLKRYPDVACLRIPTVEGGLTLFPFRYSELSFYDLPSFLLVPLAAIDLEWGRTRVGSWTNPVRALKSVLFGWTPSWGSLSVRQSASSVLVVFIIQSV
jgi:hypothetical protein